MRTMASLFFSAILALALTGFARSQTMCEGSLKGWFKFGDYCYLLQVGTAKRMSYYDAEDFCRTKGAHLVSILSHDENIFLKDTLASHYYYYSRMWIGLNILQGPGKYQWSDGQPFSYQNFIDKQQYKKESCFIFYGKEGGWRPEHCALHYTPICKIANTAGEPTPIPPLIPDVPEGNCPDGWIQFGQKCYKYFGNTEDNRLKYNEAKDACIRLGEHHDLVSIHSMEEQAFLTTQLPHLGTSAWIGLRYVESDEIGHEMVFGWTDNSRENFTYWASGHPARGTWKYCAYLNNEGFAKGEWMADYCDLKKRGYICKRPPDTSAPKQPEPTSKCDQDSFGFMDSCYRYYSTPQNWEHAEATCQRSGGNLVSINDAYEQNFLYGHISGKSDSLWTGLKNVKGTRIFRWSSELPLYYSNWGKSQPDVKDLESSCVVASSATNPMEWSVVPCDDKHPFVCEITDASSPETPADEIGDCPSSSASWIDIGDLYCYQEGQGKTDLMQWGDNSRMCMSKGMEMVSLNSEHQMKSLFSYLWKRKLNYWLGLIRSFDKATFIWTDSSSVDYTNWAEKEPSVSSSPYEKDCALISMSNLNWYAEQCAAWSGYICRALKSFGGARVARSVNSQDESNELQYPVRKETVQVTGSSGPVSLLVTTIVCLGLLVLIAALVFAWRRRNEGELPTVMPAEIGAVPTVETGNTVPKY